MNRRHALKSMMALGALGLGGCAGVTFEVDAEDRIKTVDWPAGFDEIDHFQVTHALRDGKIFAIPQPSEHRDVVIVGGGISGLTALKNLIDLDVMLVEKESETGGNSRRRSSNGIRYPLGALLSQGPIAPFTDYCNELQIPFQPLQGAHTAYRIRNKTVPDPLNEGWRELPLPTRERESFRRLAEELSALSDPVEGIFFPRTDNRQALKDLDRITFGRYLAQKQYPPSVERFMKLMLSSRLGENGDQVSAWVALYILSTLIQPAYTLPGGHGAISEIIHRYCEDRKPGAVKTRFTVVRIENKDDGRVWVTGAWPDGSLQTVSAGCAVMAAPKVYAKHAVAGLAEARPGLYDRFRYNAYLVAQVQLQYPVADVFETASADHFSRFTVAADWLANNRGSAGAGHLTVYAPYPGKAGRFALYGADAADIARTVVKDLHDLMPSSRGAIDSIRLQRWGHPMVSCAPGMDQLCAEAKEPFGRVVFAHSDSFGISGLYSAIWAGMEASADARLTLEEAAF